MTGSEVWITTAPPTPNGPLHLGHLAGPYVAADVLRRFLRADGVDVSLTTGFDDHQSYVPAAAFRQGRPAEQVADTNAAAIAADWDQARVEFDAVVRPRSDRGYATFVQDFFTRLVHNGAIVPQTRPLPWCERCSRWLSEAFLVGACPHCGAATNGNACEACGRPNDCADLGDPRCVVCSCAAKLRDCERLYFPLAPFADALAQYWATVQMPPHLHALCEQLLADGLPSIAISHPADWGVPVTTPGFAGQRVYVWLEMVPGYLWPRRDRPPGPPNVQFFGFDNGYFHAALFPAMLLAHNATTALPTAFIVNEFYQLEGRKFSTSRRHAIWAGDAVAKLGSDVVRRHVLQDRPHGRQTSLEPSTLYDSRDQLWLRWNGWLDRLVAAIGEDCAGRVPSELPGGSDWDLLCARVEQTVGQLREAYTVAGFDPRRAVALLDEVVWLVTDFGHVQAHHRDRPSGGTAFRAGLAGQLAVAAGLAALAEPVMPEGAQRLSALLGVAPGRRVDAHSLTPLPGGHPITPPAEKIFGALPTG